jgi:uncharacterized membrane protein
VGRDLDIPCVRQGGGRVAERFEGKRVLLVMDDRIEREGRRFPAAAGILLGLGLGGFFDGIVLHQLLQWHHMLSSAGYPPDTIENLRVNTFADGLFHTATYGFVLAGVLLLWRRAHRPHLWWSGRMLAGSMLTGFGAFNLIEGAINHHLLKIHHVNETVPPGHWIWWDVGFLTWGAAMFFVGILLLRHGGAPCGGELPTCSGD